MSFHQCSSWLWCSIFVWVFLTPEWVVVVEGFARNVPILVGPPSSSSTTNANIKAFGNHPSYRLRHSGSSSSSSFHSFRLTKKLRASSREEVQDDKDKSGGSVAGGDAPKTTKLRPKLVILIPAYNERDRIASTLRSYHDFVSQSPVWNQTISHLLVVDDGSTDGTSTVVKNFYEDNNNIPKNPTIHCITLPTNQGKGAALSKGIDYINQNMTTSSCYDQVKGMPPSGMDQHQQQDEKEDVLILTQDADGSGDLVYLEPMYQRLCQLLLQERTTPTRDGTDTTNNNHLPNRRAMVVGNRNYKFFSKRGITRWGFQTCVRWIMTDFSNNNGSSLLRVQDSQCGYKLMTLSAALPLYRQLHLTGWSHDVEILYRATLYDIPIHELALDWIDVMEGSKVIASGIVKVSIRMLLDILRLRWEYSVTKRWRPTNDSVNLTTNATE